jgi:predicted MPP superfamily phosphohydrolase
MNMNKIGFFIIFTIFASINFYIFTRGRQALPKSAVILTVYTSLFLLCSLSFFIVVIFENKLPLTFSALFENIGGFWMILFFFFLVAVLFADLLRLSNHFFGIYPSWIKSNYSQVKLIYFGIVILTLMAFSVIGYFRFNNPQTVTLNLDFSNEAEYTYSTTIVAISDVHLGNVIRKKRLEKYVALINKQNPDIVVIVGDLFDRNLHSVKAQGMDVVLRQLQAKNGVYAVLGNHDYFSNVDSAMKYMSLSGIHLLRDSAVTIDNKFVLIGRDDYSNHHRKPIKSLLSGIDTNLPTILLDHQPAKLNEAVENNIDFQISGHTHNGQIYPFSLVVKKIFELNYGYLKKGNTQFYVSSGLGLWGAPIRLGTQSEIVKIQIKTPNLHFISK